MATTASAPLPNKRTESPIKTELVAKVPVFPIKVD